MCCLKYENGCYECQDGCHKGAEPNIVNLIEKMDEENKEELLKLTAEEVEE